MQFKAIDLGVTDFQAGYAAQKEIFSQVKSGALESALIICRHEPVITLGRVAKKENILLSQNQLSDRGIEVYAIERGGDVTYHGPGQMTAYPIFNLAYLKKDIHLFLRQLEDVIKAFLGDFGIKGEIRPGLTGVWADREKIASIGISIRNWITFHGLTINVKKDDLANFSLIRPCGMNIRMTSVESLLNKEVDINAIKENLIRHFKQVFNT